MISFEPVIEYKLGKCHLSRLECYALVSIYMCEWDDDRSCDVLDALHNGDWKLYYPRNDNATSYGFGRYEANFILTPDGDHVEMWIFDGDDSDSPMYRTVLDEDMEMDVIDFTTYRDPEEYDG